MEINCAAIPETLLESELFGYSPGAFTGAKSTGKTGKFEEANNGTLFLDEIGDIPSSTQVKLLRFTQEKYIEKLGDNKKIPVNVRIISATNRTLSNGSARTFSRRLILPSLCSMLFSSFKAENTIFLC